MSDDFLDSQPTTSTNDGWDIEDTETTESTENTQDDAEDLISSVVERGIKEVQKDAKVIAARHDPWDISEEEGPDQEEPIEEASEDDEDAPESTKDEQDEQDDQEEESSSSDEIEADKDEEEISDETKAQLQKGITRKKPFVLYDKDEKIVLSPKALVQIKEGKEVKQVSLFDLHQSYASSQEIEKKVRQVNQDSKVLEERVKFERDSLEASQRIFKSQVDEYEKYLKNLGKAAQEGKALHALAEMFEAAGVESLPVIRSMRKAVLDQAKELVDCSPEQMEYFDAIEELHYLKYKKEKELSEKAQREKEQAEENKIREVMTSFEIPDRPQYVKILNRLNELKAQGQIKEEITPESVGTYWKEFKKTETLFKVLQDKAPELATSQETVKAIFETVRATNPTVKEFEEFLSHLKSTASEQAAKANGKKKLVEKTSPISAGTKQTAKRDSLFI